MTRVALLAHGAGSCPDTARRLLGPVVDPGDLVLAVDARGGVHDVVRRLHEAAHGHEVAVAAGISLGAHAIAIWALDGGEAGALGLVMPAWTGAPEAIAGMTATSADAVERLGRAAVLDDIAAMAAGDWVLDELARGWATYTDHELTRALRAASASAAPTTDDLERLEVATAVVSLDDDPLHPRTVAQAWADAIPGAVLEVVPRHAPLADRGALGRAARRALTGRAAAHRPP
jgi:pimeloyl-ACP methyl ester carboxylesterase